MGDLSFAPREWQREILLKIKDSAETTFLIQSKNPAKIYRLFLPENLIIGTTIETDREDIYEGISKAPSLFYRFWIMSHFRHKRKAVTIEPILEFDIDCLISWILEISPEFVYVGYDSKWNYLPEPTLEKTELLIERLRELGFDVRPKLLRKAWWE
jgi:hypothetical protein